MNYLNEIIQRDMDGNPEDMEVSEKFGNKFVHLLDLSYSLCPECDGRPKLNAVIREGWYYDEVLDRPVKIDEKLDFFFRCTECSNCWMKEDIKEHLMRYAERTKERYLYVDKKRRPHAN